METQTSRPRGGIQMREESSREVVDRIVKLKMERNATATAPGHLNRIVWNEIEDYPEVIKEFVMDAINVAYERIVERERASVTKGVGVGAGAGAGGAPNAARTTPTRASTEFVPRKPSAPNADQVRVQTDYLRTMLDAYTWPNGKPLLKATVREVQQFMGWEHALLASSKLKHAKPTDEIGKHLSFDEIYKLRTWSK